MNAEVVAGSETENRAEGTIFDLAGTGVVGEEGEEIGASSRTAE